MNTDLEARVHRLEELMRELYRRLAILEAQVGRGRQDVAALRPQSNVLGN